jgi:head-tail adaptor
VNPGRLDTRVTFRRQPVLAGNKRGPFADWFSPWAEWIPAGGRKSVTAGLVEDEVEGMLRIRASANARQLTNEGRVRFRNGAEFAIRSVSMPDRSGFLTVTIARTIGG